MSGSSTTLPWTRWSQAVWAFGVFIQSEGVEIELRDRGRIVVTARPGMMDPRCMPAFRAFVDEHRKEIREYLDSL